MMLFIMDSEVKSAYAVKSISTALPKLHKTDKARAAHNVLTERGSCIHNLKNARTKSQQLRI
jgi:hypothetical protein